MSTNKNAQLRYHVLDRCFHDFSKRYTFANLLDAVNDALDEVQSEPVNVRQLREDIKYMRSEAGFNAPIETKKFDHGNACYYLYEDKHFSIYKNELTVQESSDLRAVISMLGRFRGVPANAWLEEVISNLEYRFGVKANAVNAISFDQNDKLRGLEHLSDLIDAIMTHQPLEIEYLSYKGNEIVSTFHPYHLKQYNNRWFLFGLEISKKYGDKIVNKALDRIVSFKAAKVPFIPNTFVDFDTYFKDVIGVTVLPEVEVATIILKFQKDRFPYIVSKPIHSSQTVLDVEDCLLQIKVQPNKELETLLFSFGPHVEILAPAWLRDSFADKIEENIKKYKEDSSD